MSRHHLRLPRKEMIAIENNNLFDRYLIKKSFNEDFRVYKETQLLILMLLLLL